jgi:hypothetical protein
MINKSSDTFKISFNNAIWKIWARGEGYGGEASDGHRLWVFWLLK